MDGSLTRVTGFWRQHLLRRGHSVIRALPRICQIWEPQWLCLPRIWEASQGHLGAAGWWAHRDMRVGHQQWPQPEDGPGPGVGATGSLAPRATWTEPSPDQTHRENCEGPWDPSRSFTSTPSTTPKHHRRNPGVSSNRMLHGCHWTWMRCFSSQPPPGAWATNRGMFNAGRYHDFRCSATSSTHFPLVQRLYCSEDVGSSFHTMRLVLRVDWKKGRENEGGRKEKRRKKRGREERNMRREEEDL